MTDEQQENVVDASAVNQPEEDSLPVGIDAVNKNAKMLKELDLDVPFQSIKEAEYLNLSNDTEAMKTLAGEPKFDDWPAFKKGFVEHQKRCGFHWKPVRGGTVRLEVADIPSEVGIELAEHAKTAGYEGGSFDELLEEKLKSLYLYMDLGENRETIEYSKARKSFQKKLKKGNKSYKFHRGRGNRYYLAVDRYEFKPGEKKLGKEVKKWLLRELELKKLEDTQVNRTGLKFENADFEGYKIQRHPEGDRFLMYSFELKKKNHVDSVSEAISQAVNYRARSHFTFIIIPFFDQYSFHDPDRFEHFMKMCRENELGVISIDLDIDEKPHKIKGLNIVAQAPETPLDDPQRLDVLVRDSGWEVCPLCRHIVRTEDRGEHCGWMAPKSNGQMECMKTLMERMVSGDSTSGSGNGEGGEEG